MTLNDYIELFVNNIRDNAYYNGMLPDQAFFEQILEQLELMGEFDEVITLNFHKHGTNRRIMRADAYAYDSTDNSLVIIANDYEDTQELVNLNFSDIEMIRQRMLNFLDEINNNTIEKFIDPSLDVYRYVREIKQHLETQHVSTSENKSVHKIRLIILTNKKINTKRISRGETHFLNRKIDMDIWDIERFYELDKSGREHEQIHIDLREFNDNKGLDFLKAKFDGNNKYDAYLTIIPGNVLGKLYDHHGSRMLEGNVRSFLSFRGKINRGIRNTITYEPQNFFAYNNGIACTAKEIEFSHESREIVGFKDLQIINGGQTTVSITSALREGKDLSEIYVPMKVTIIKDDDYDSMVKYISQYANSQNKVTDADFFASHPFHVELEKISKKIPAPPKEGEHHQTYWFYERTRGQYEQEMFGLTRAKMNEFIFKNPKKQVLKKEQVAKYYMAAHEMRPDLVSLGAQRNLKQFAEIVEKIWTRNKHFVNEEFFKHIVVYAIVFLETDRIVYRSDWYQKGGYKLNIVPYTIAKIFSLIPKDDAIDFDRIWKAQKLYPSFEEEINRIARITNDFIMDSDGRIVTEYAKRQDTWKKFNDVKIKLSQRFIDDLKIKDFQIGKSDTKSGSTKLEPMIFVVNLAQSKPPEFWMQMIQEGQQRRLITGDVATIITRKMIRLSGGNYNAVPNHFEAKKVLDYLIKLLNDGVEIPELYEHQNS